MMPKYSPKVLKTFLKNFIIDPQNITEPNFLPEAIIQGAVKIDDLFFDDVGYVGAMGDTDWSLGWTAYPER